MTAPIHPLHTQIAEPRDSVDRRFASTLISHVEQVVIGKRSVVDLAVTTLMAGGHLLIEDVPGLGKTLLARTPRPFDRR